MIRFTINLCCHAYCNHRATSCRTDAMVKLHGISEDEIHKPFNITVISTQEGQGNEQVKNLPWGYSNDLTLKLFSSCLAIQYALHDKSCINQFTALLLSWYNHHVWLDLMYAAMSYSPARVTCRLLNFVDSQFASAYLNMFSGCSLHLSDYSLLHYLGM